jgi:degradative hydroxymethylglutaryl-CoA reductase
MSNYFSDFFKKTIKERMQILEMLYPQLNGAFIDGMNLKTADLMIENCIGTIKLPVGLGLHFKINSKDYIIPMSTEEPSIIAAASNAAKLIKEAGGFQGFSSAPVMRGQIQVLDINTEQAKHAIDSNKQALIIQANTFYCPRMVSRGGGVLDINLSPLTPTSAVIEISVNVGEAMGANIVNSICEGLANDIKELLNCRIGLKILSNFCTERTVKVSFKVPIHKLAYKNVPGDLIARGFMESYEFARLSVYRACTHNKGILNGIQAVGLATGQDTRALEAAAHTWACRSGKYQPMNEYMIENGCLVGRIELPMAVGTKGGALESNPGYKASSYILGTPSSSELSQIIASVGLACNFSAIRAMVTEGIQKGHMGLHAKNIAVAVGVPSEIVNEVVEYMKQCGNISQQTALDYLSAHKLHTISRKHPKTTFSLNTFNVNLSDTSPPLKLNVAFHCPNMHGIHIYIDKASDSYRDNIQKILFNRHNYAWITVFLSMLNQVKYNPELPRTNTELQIKLKLICIWVNEISISLISTWGIDNTRNAIGAIIDGNEILLKKLVTGCQEYVEYGVHLELELWHILNFHLDAFISESMPSSALLAQTIRNELQSVLESNLKAASIGTIAFDEQLKYRKKFMCGTLMYLCDCIGEAKINNALIQELLDLGDVIEIISTARRDFTKFNKGEVSHPNIYLTWTQQRSTSFYDYFVYIKQIVAIKSKNFKIPQIDLIRKVEDLLDVYYNISPKL